MAPPACPKSNPFRADWRFIFSFANSTDDGEAQVPPGTVPFLYFAQFVLVQQGHATTRPCCFELYVRKRFLPIPGRSVRADLIGRQFWTILMIFDDFDEN